jgi:hypothetical protein
MEWSLVRQSARNGIGPTGASQAREPMLSLIATLATARLAVDRSNNVPDGWPASITTVSDARQRHDYCRRSQADRGERHNR